MKLYHHKTTGGAEYLTDTFIKWEHNGKKGKEGRINDETKYVVRIDGDIEKDAELTIKEDKKTESDPNNAQHPVRQKAIKIIEQVIEPFTKKEINGTKYYDLEDEITK